jgi:starch synthase
MAVVWHHKLREQEPRWSSQGSVLTIHNVAHQGIIDVDYARKLSYAVDDLLDVERNRYPNTINVLARAVNNADIITTVSPEYARELQSPEFGAGMELLFRQRSGDLHGILNGIDVDTFKPATDPHIAA